MKKNISIVISSLTSLMMLSACGDNNKSAELDDTLFFSEGSTSSLETVVASTEAVATENYNVEQKTDQDMEMPSPFEYIGGDENMGFYSTVNLKLGSIDMSFVEMVGYDAFEEWINSTSSSESNLTSIDELANLYSFIKYFNIPDETVRETLYSIRTGEANVDLSDEEIDLILSDDSEAIAQYFVSENAILKGDNIYSLKWIYSSSIDDYAANNISVSEVEAAAIKMEQYPLTTEACEALKQKVSFYALTCDNEDVFSQNNLTVSLFN